MTLLLLKLGVAATLSVLVLQAKAAMYLQRWTLVYLSSSHFNGSTVQKESRALSTALSCAMHCNSLSWCSVWCLETVSACHVSSLIVGGSVLEIGADVVKCYTKNYPEYAFGATIYWPIGSIDLPHRVKENLVDGVYDGSVDSCAITDLVVKPWFLLDLGTPRSVREVVLIAEPDEDVVSSFQNFEVKVGQRMELGDFSTYTLLGKFEGPSNVSQTVILTAPYPITGQYVSIQMIYNGTFQICHLEIR